ncbi:hypothetical protein C8F01DRAFT_1192571 [Mycena amicta]|nr:hypothetical protein C8F01DRAFT_1192571 [Mycena amicta]
MSPSTNPLAAYMRVASLTISAYDYFQTMPFEVRLSAEAWRWRRMSPSFVLFMLIRYTSILVLTTSNISYFFLHFSFAECQRYFLIPSIFKLLQAMVSQAILAIRAYNLSRKSTHFGHILLSAYVISCTFQWATSLFGKNALYDPNVRNCASTSPNGDFGGWIFYTVAIVYDFATSVLCAVFLLRLTPQTLRSSLMGSLARMMLVDGLAYFVILALANLLSLGFYRATYLNFKLNSKQAGELQTAAASLGYCVRWIMTQKLIIHLHEASVQRRDESINNALSIGTDPLTSPWARARTRTTLSLTIPASDDHEYDYDYGDQVGIQPEEKDTDGGDGDVKVRMERTVRVESVPKEAHGLH